MTKQKRTAKDCIKKNSKKIAIAVVLILTVIVVSFMYNHGFGLLSSASVVNYGVGGCQVRSQDSYLTDSANTPYWIECGTSSQAYTDYMKAYLQRTGNTQLTFPRTSAGLQEAKTYLNDFYNLSKPASTPAPSITPKTDSMVIIWSDTQDANIAIDGNYKGKTTTAYVSIPISSGAHRVEVSKWGYYSYLKDITVESGKTTKLDVYLTAGTSSTAPAVTSQETPKTQGYNYECPSGFKPNEDKTACVKSTPGFEAIFAIAGIMILVIWKRGAAIEGNRLKRTK